MKKASQEAFCFIFASINEHYMDGQYRKDIYPGLEVAIILKKDQRTGKLTYGIVKDLSRLRHIIQGV